jgi:hypothetical protein
LEADDKGRMRLSMKALIEAAGRRRRILKQADK